MFKKNISYIILLSTLTFTSIINAEEKLYIEYNSQQDLLTLDINDVYLDTTLLKLSEKIPFELMIEGGEAHRKITFSMSGSSTKVITQLIKPNNVILSQSDKEPHKLTNVILLPVGEQSMETRIREIMPAPALSADTEKNHQRQQHYERRIERKLMGLGRKADLFQNNDNDNNQQ